MPISLHSALVPTWLRLLACCENWLDKAEAFAAENSIAEADMLDLRLIADMLPFKFQVKSMATHSLLAVEGVRTGTFSPDMTPPPETFAALKAKIGGAAECLKAVTEAEAESWIGKQVIFSAGQLRLEFVAEEFLLSFSQSNFHFHATTAYNILRSKGVPIGKRDFMGNLPIKR